MSRWAHSSAGQSASLIRTRPVVRIHLSPPRLGGWAGVLCKGTQLRIEAAAAPAGCDRGRSSTGRARALQARGCRFDPGRLHHFGPVRVGSPACRRLRRPGLPIGLRVRSRSLTTEYNGTASKGGTIYRCCVSGAHVRKACGPSHVCGQVTKGTRWMSWRQEAMKDVVSCDKPRGAANKRYIRGFPNGATWRPVTGVIPV